MTPSTVACLVSVHGILQTRILEWVAVPFSREIFPTQGSNLGVPHCRHSPFEPPGKPDGKDFSTSIDSLIRRVCTLVKNVDNVENN